jgi:putative protein kinase ArgK-like GTPase of G3E family
MKIEYEHLLVAIPISHGEKTLMNITQLIESLSYLSSQPLSLIGIDGRPGSGKTTLVAQLEQSLNVQTIY